MHAGRTGRGTLRIAAGNWINTGQTYGWLLRGQRAGHAAQIATSTLLWVIVPLALGLLRTLRREVRSGSRQERTGAGTTARSA